MVAKQSHQVTSHGSRQTEGPRVCTRIPISVEKLFKKRAAISSALFILHAIIRVPSPSTRYFLDRNDLIKDLRFYRSMLYQFINFENVELVALLFALFILHAFHLLPLKYFDISSIETSGIDFIKIRSMLYRLITRQNIEPVALSFALFILYTFHLLSLKYFDISSIKTSGIDFINL